jgi:hypothetical protein
MNDLTPIRPEPPYDEFRMRSEAESLSAELAKMLSLVAPVTMSSDQQALWIVSAVDALKDIRASEVAEISAEVRRSVTRPSQIVPEIAKLVAVRRERRAGQIRSERPMIEGPPPPRDVMAHRGEPMTEEETAELNGILEKLGATARYRMDGSRYFPERA